jgi:hypothetical protein
MPIVAVVLFMNEDLKIEAAVLPLQPRSPVLYQRQRFGSGLLLVGRTDPFGTASAGSVPQTGERKNAANDRLTAPECWKARFTAAELQIPLFPIATIFTSNLDLGESPPHHSIALC